MLHRTLLGGIIIKIKKKHVVSYLFLIPSFAFVCIFLYYPVFTAFYHSFTKWDLVTSVWVGIDNFIRMVSDETFITSVKNQTIITVTEVVKNIVFPLLAAELIFLLKGNHIKYFFRTGFIIPLLVPGIVVVLLWLQIYNPSTGLLNNILNIADLSAWAQPWLGQESTALWAIIMIGFPFVSGLSFLIFYAAIGSFNQEIIEAARIDGANSWNVVKSIHIPLLVPHFKVVIILVVLSSLQDITKVLVLTNGGPGTATMIPALNMYIAAFSGSEYGYASAIGTSLFIVIIAITMFNMKILKSKT